MRRSVSYKKPHSNMSMLVSGPREHQRMARENKQYDQEFRRRQANVDSRKSRRYE